jgi:hypothetical protein
MTPPISKDWWLAAALSTATVPAALAQSPTGAGGADRTGVVTAVAPGGKVTGNNELMVVGSSVVPGQRLRTDAGGPMHVLFMDQSALTLGPDAELTIDEFTFDPSTKQGRIRLGLVKGLVRVVGGQISKNTATTIATAHGKVEILGGITMVETDGNRTSGTFLFGQGMTVTDNSANTQNVTRPGFGVAMSGGGVSPPSRVPADVLNATISRLESARPAFASVTGATQPAPAPAGQLISTGSMPGGVTSPSTLANDRLQSVVDNFAGTIPSNTLRELLGTGQLQIQS